MQMFHILTYYFARLVRPHVRREFANVEDYVVWFVDMHMTMNGHFSLNGPE